MTSTSTNTFTYIEKILSWASNTTEYNAILILIENPELIPSESINVFISILSEMRCVHGIPIGLVFFSISKELIQKDLISNQLDLSSLNGQVGVVIREFDSVSSNVLVDDLMERLFGNENTHTCPNLPIIPSKKVMEKMFHEFKYNHGSVVSFMNQLKMALAHHFAMPGKLSVYTYTLTPYAYTHSNHLC